MFIVGELGMRLYEMINKLVLLLWYYSTWWCMLAAKNKLASAAAYEVLRQGRLLLQLLHARQNDARAARHQHITPW